MGQKRNSLGREIPRSIPREQSKRYTCAFEGCGKSYSRAEHLARHQLNHNPKDIFKCDFPGCTRSFVRQDLCIRHRERHDNGRDHSNDSSHDSSYENQRREPRRVGRPRLSSKRNGAYHSSDNVLRANIQGSEDMDDSLDGAHSAEAAHNDHSAFVGGTDFTVAENLPPFDNRTTVPLDVDRLYASRQVESSYNHNTDGMNMSDMFGGNSISDPFNESPGSVRDDFTAWLFDENNNNQTGIWANSMPAATAFSSYDQPFGALPMFSNSMMDPSFQDSFVNFLPVVNPDGNSEYVSTSQMSALSTARYSTVLKVMEARFNDGENNDVANLRRILFQGNRNNDDHVLSHSSLERFIGVYWHQFHKQMPILHQPTFATETCHDFLLLAIISIGAACTNGMYGRSFQHAASRLANFIIWHLRWQVFMHADFRPPAKLWVFQTLLLVEIYEKMHSTRAMHERAHIHCATTINLMRRGTTLIGDSQETENRTPATPDDAWNRWIHAEAIRRAAFAAFMIDASHAVMFGHAAAMVVHELRLPLPCDDALWSATSAAEIGRIQSSLQVHGIKPVSFLEGLKKILTGRRVKTNDFGRASLMAGLLSITWHLHQRDLQISSLGASQTLGMPGTWRDALTKSFDFWKRDFDDSMSQLRSATFGWQGVGSTDDQDYTVSADVLHHLSHITLHIDILDCQIYAGAPKVFGRKISRIDYDKTKHKMADWAVSPAARKAVFHALKVVRAPVLQATDSLGFYDCRDDSLLNRSWVLYYSLLVLFSYGFALDGTLQPFPAHLLEYHLDDASPAPSLRSGWLASTPSTPHTLNVSRDRALEDAQAYFQSFANCNTYQDLEQVHHGRNRLVGLLVLFEGAFKDARWELLQEAAIRLRQAIEILKFGERS